MSLIHCQSPNATYEILVRHRPSWSTKLALFNRIWNVETESCIRDCYHTHRSYKTAAQCAARMLKELGQ